MFHGCARKVGLRFKNLPNFAVPSAARISDDDRVRGNAPADSRRCKRPGSVWESLEAEHSRLERAVD
jgi:hypothetical protein